MPVKTNFSIDALVLLLLLIGMEPALTGGAVHEWLNLCFAGAILVHLLLHWNWIAATLPRMLGSTSRRTRVNLWLNVLSFLVFTLMILSGLLMSRHVLASSQAGDPRHSSWHGIHSASADILLVLIGLHFAMHWKWIVHTLMCRFVLPIREQFAVLHSAKRRIQ